VRLYAGIAATGYKLLERLRQRFPWLEEYYLWQEKRVVYTFPPLRSSRWISEQKGQFINRLANHILVVQMGQWWELWGDYSTLPTIQGWQRFPSSQLPTVRKILWESGRPVGWVRETGQRITNINERELFCRWPGARMDL